MTLPTPPQPTLPRARFSPDRWRRSVKKRRDPQGVKIAHIKRVEGPAHESLPFIFPAETYAASIRVAGPAAQFVQLDPEEDGNAIWLLQPGTIVIIATLSKRKRGRHYLMLEVIIVEDLAQTLERRLDQLSHRPAPGHMESLRELIHTPKYKQRQMDESHPKPTPEGKDPHGE